MSTELQNPTERMFINIRKTFDNEYNSMQLEVTVLRNDIQDLRFQINKLEDENRRLRRDLKETINNQLETDRNVSEGQIQENLIGTGNSTTTNFAPDSQIVKNLENQLSLVREERDNAIQMWQQSLNQIRNLEESNEILKLKANPQNISYQLQMRQAHEDFMRSEAVLIEEIGSMKQDINKKNDEVNSLNIYCNDLKILIENLRSQINEKDHEKQDFIKKEFGYDEAVISLQNIINDLDTENQSLLKDNDLIREKKRETELRFTDLIRQKEDSERKILQLRQQLEENTQFVQQAKLEKQRAQMMEKKQQEDHERLHKAIVELIKEAVNRTKVEVEGLKRIYNTNLEKLIAEYTLLETDRNEKVAQLEKALRSKKSVEEELEKMSNENLRATNKDNGAYEELYRRLCSCEREKDEFYNKLESRESEFKKLQKMYESEKDKVYQITNDYKDKTAKLIYDSDKLTEERLKLTDEIDELKKKINELNNEKDQLQKKLTKQIQIGENQLQTKESEYTTKIKSIQDNHRQAMFELRQLLNMQQRMSNKWKEECHMITTQAEQKVIEFRGTIENLRNYNDKLANELQDAKRKEFENEKIISNNTTKIKALEDRVRDAEVQATEATRRIAKQVARERIMLYEKHLLESDLDRNKFDDTFQKGKNYLRNMDDEPSKISRQIEDTAN